MDFVNRLVERTRSAERAAVRPVIGPGLAGTGPREPLLVIDEHREVVASDRHDDGTAIAPLPHMPPANTARPTLETTRADRGTYEPGPALVTPELEPLVAVQGATPAVVVPAVTTPRSVASAHTAERLSTVPAPLVEARTGDPAPTFTRNAPSTTPPRTARATTSSSEAKAGDQVIRVHIGRIDVRAPAPVAAPAAKRPADPLPSVALGRYLDDRGRRR